MRFLPLAACIAVIAAIYASGAQSQPMKDRAMLLDEGYEVRAVEPLEHSPIPGFFAVRHQLEWIVTHIPLDSIRGVRTEWSAAEGGIRLPDSKPVRETVIAIELDPRDMHGNRYVITIPAEVLTPDEVLKFLAEVAERKRNP